MRQGVANLHGQQQRWTIWPDRWTAGRDLATKLEPWRDRSADTTVIGLPRGGIAVAAAVARELQLPLASWAVRKLALPTRSEYAIGAIAAGDAVVWNQAALQRAGVSSATQQALLETESHELRRRQQCFGDPPGSTLRGRRLIVVDDGIATGMTVLAALQSLRKLGPRELVLAVPVLDRQLLPVLDAQVDALVAAQVVDGLMAVGAYYTDFAQLSDTDVLALLHDTKGSRPPQR